MIPHKERKGIGRPKGWKMPKSVKQQISESKKGYVHDQDTKDKIAASLVSYFDDVGRVVSSSIVLCDTCNKLFTTPNKYYPNKNCQECGGNVWYRGGVNDE